MKNILTLSTIATATLLTGCASTIQAEKAIKQTNTETENTYQGAKIKTTSAAQDETRDSKGNFAKVARNWVNPNPLPRYDLESEKAMLPPFFQDKVSLTMPGKVSLVEVLSELQRAKKIKVVINQDVYNSSIGTGSLISGSSGGAGAGAAGAAGAPPAGVSLMAIGTNGALPVFVNDFVFRGTLEESLDLMASKANISWKWNGSAIEVFRFESKNYTLSALAGKTTSSASVTMAGSSSSSGGAGTATTASTNGVVRTSDLTTWEDVKAYLMTITSKDGKIAVMESSGIITVKDTPMVHATIEKAIKELNDNLGKQIYMDVKIYAVTMSDADNYGLNWNLAWAQAANKYGITLANGANATTSSPISIGTTINSGPFAGTSATLKALSSLGKTSVVNEFTVSTLNGQTTPIGNSTKQDYVKQIKVTTTGSGSEATTSVEVTPDAVYDGLNMSVTPKIQKDLDKILLEYSLTLNSIDDMSQTYTDSVGNKVTLPKTSIKNILQRSALRSGQTLVLSGFKQNVSKVLNDGVGSANFQLLGGSRNANNASQYLVITVTPYVAQD